MIIPFCIKRGNKANLPALLIGELAITLDTKELYIGTTGGNIKIAGGDGDSDSFNFDDIPKGYEYSTTKSGNVTTETIKLTTTQATYATRTNTKNSTTQWTIRTICSTKGVDKTEVWTKTNGNWKGVVR